MKVRRFFAKDAREAMRQVRETLTSDAVILSNRRIADGVEVIAAIGYDERTVKKSPTASQQKHAFNRQIPDADSKVTQAAGSHHHNTTGAQGTASPTKTRQSAHINTAINPDYYRASAASPSPSEAAVDWQTDPALGAMRAELNSLRGLLEHQLSGLAWHDLKIRKPLEAELLRRLLVMGFVPQLSKQLAAQMSQMLADDTSVDDAWSQLIEQLIALTPVFGHDVIAQGGVIALVGPTGVGKTTTLAKMAARYVMHHGPESVALISLDANRIASSEQIKTFGKILGVATRVCSDIAQLPKILEAFYDKSLILIDTPGAMVWDSATQSHFETIKKTLGKLDVYLTLSSTQQHAVLSNVMSHCCHNNLRGCVITKLDETASLGEVISCVIAHNCPIAYLTDGYSVPNHIRVANAAELITLASQLGRDEAGHHDQETLALKIGGLKADETSY